MSNGANPFAVLPIQLSSFSAVHVSTVVPQSKFSALSLFPGNLTSLQESKRPCLKVGETVVDAQYCNVTSTIIDVSGVHVQGLIAVASQLAVQSSYVVPAGRATSCQLCHGF